MLFTSYEFLLFAALLLGLYYVIPKRFQWMLLLLASYLFYWIANPAYLLFIGITTISVYAAARLMEQNAERQADYIKQHKEELSKEEKKEYKKQQKKIRFRLAALFVCLNIAILAVVKYTNFFFRIFAPVISLFSGSKEIPSVSLLVPMGISFYTFQAVGYLVDVYRGTIKAEKNLFKFALFISFFPQLVQGPISRFSDLAETMFSEHPFDKKNVAYGLQRVLWGYFKKLVIADRIFAAVSTTLTNPQEYQGVYLVVGMIFYTIQLYADFTGGIDVTIGIAQAFGIRLKENFNLPYFSTSLKEYWRRWHISMCSWFRDYVFYPVSSSSALQKFSKFSRKHFGDSIGKRLPVYVASFVVWFSTGLWHGANWNFIVWGLANWAVLMISEELEPLYAKFHSRFPALDKWPYQVFCMVRTYLLVCCLNLFDCYSNVSDTFRAFWSMISVPNWNVLFDGSLLKIGLSELDYMILFFAVLLMSAVSIVKCKTDVRELISSRSYPVRVVLWFGLFLIILFMGTYGIGYDSSQFIYNQF